MLLIRAVRFPGIGVSTAREWTLCVIGVGQYAEGIICQAIENQCPSADILLRLQSAKFKARNIPIRVFAGHFIGKLN